MKSKTLAAFLAALVYAGGSAGAAVVVTQSQLWTDGNNATAATSNSISFDVVNANSILVVSAYVDNAPGVVSFSTLDFGGQAPDATVGDSRMTTFLFLNPSTASGLNFSFANVLSSDGTTPDASGIGLIFYEVSGANLSLASITTATASNTINTTMANELVVSFAGRNNSTAPTENSTLFTGNDWNSTGSLIRGGGSISSASATASTAGSQDITWTNASEGRIAYAFEPAVVPEPGSLVLGMGALGLLFRRRRRA